MSSKNAGIFVRKLLLSLLLIGFGVVIGRYTATETEQYSDNRAAAINRSSLPVAENAAQQDVTQQDTEKAAYKAAPVEVVSIEKIDEADDKPCVAPTVDAAPPIADIEDVTRLIDKLDDGSGQTQTSSAASVDNNAMLESLAKTIQASGEKIKSDFEVQPRNDEWAAEMENNIQKYFYYSQYSSGVFPEQIECKETICKIAYLAKAQPLCDLVTSELTTQDWWKFSTFQHSRSKSSEKDDVTCTIFATN